MLFRLSPIAKIYSAALLSIFCSSASAISLDDLRRSEDLTPAKFASYFRGFDFQFRKEIQSPEVFLATKSGDCDDYSTLAAEVLREKGYTPRLIAVRMPGITHVICYVEETKSYLDYNQRSGANLLVRCDNSLSAIAESVARSYRLRWSSASEFTFESGLKRLVQTVVEPRKDPRIFASLFRN